MPAERRPAPSSPSLAPGSASSPWPCSVVLSRAGDALLSPAAFAGLQAQLCPCPAERPGGTTAPWGLLLPRRRCKSWLGLQRSAAALDVPHRSRAAEESGLGKAVGKWERSPWCCRTRSSPRSLQLCLYPNKPALYPTCSIPPARKTAPKRLLGRAGLQKGGRKRSSSRRALPLPHQPALAARSAGLEQQRTQLLPWLLCAGADSFASPEELKGLLNTEQWKLSVHFLGCGKRSGSVN